MNLTNQTTVAVVDDDLELGALIGDYLQTNGFKYRLFESGEAFLNSDLTSINILVLDVGLPGMDGFAVCKEVRKASSLPIIMLTAASDDVDRILGLELGADDYRGKPFNPRELLARIKASLRRVTPREEDQINLVISHAERRGYWQGQLIELTGAEFELLALLQSSNGQIVSRDQISVTLKGYSASPFDRSIDTIDIADGEFLILVGPSGCGKSTLMNTIAGLDEVTAGQLLLEGEDVTDRSPKDRDIAMVFQSYALYPTMNVARNISFGLEMRGISRAERDQRVQEVSSLLQIDHLLDRKPSQLSGGQRQRVAMGRALARSPRVYLFDEPLSNLDAKLRVEMRTEIKKLHKRLGTTIVYVTHDQIEAMTLADRIAVMKDGVVQQLGTPNEIYDDPANQFVAGFMGSPPMNFVPCDVDSDGRVAIQTSGQIFSITIPQSSTLKEKNVRQAILGLRPEMLTEPKPGRISDWIKSFHMDFEVTEPMGADTIAIGQWNHIEVLARLSPEAGLSAGKATSVEVDLSKVVLFDPDSGQRIR